MFKRVGECNLCGQCCGTNGENPWSRNFPDSIRAWQAIALYKSFPQSKLCGVTGKDGERLQIQMSGEALVDGLSYPYEWGPGLHKPGNAECPFLNENRTCALYGSTYHWMWENACQPAPPLKMTKEQVIGFMDSCPDCSYDWESIE